MSFEDLPVEWEDQKDLKLRSGVILASYLLICFQNVHFWSGFVIRPKSKSKNSNSYSRLKSGGG
jgi:hypothetical protein